MITNFSDNDFDLTNILPNNHYSRRIIANWQAYGTEYDFCKFFDITNGEQRAFACAFNSSLTISSIGEITDELLLSEIETLFKITKPTTAEMNMSLAEKLEWRLTGANDEYVAVHRCLFRFKDEQLPCGIEVNTEPKLDDVFEILEQCFPSLHGSHDLWLTDTSHRLRRGMSEVFMVENFSTATVQYKVNGFALVGHAATLPQYRGKHYARNLLYYIGRKLCEDGYEVILHARAHRESYYTEIGFIPEQRDIVFERICFDE